LCSRLLRGDALANEWEEETYSDVEELGRRVFYTLTDVSGGKPIHRQAMFLSLLCEKLESKGILSKDEIENMLFDTVSGPGTSAALQ
jgi:hypothetical protein